MTLTVGFYTEWQSDGVSVDFDCVSSKWTSKLMGKLFTLSVGLYVERQIAGVSVDFDGGSLRGSEK